MVAGSFKSEFEERDHMDKVSEQRLWKSLDEISIRLTNIESKLSEIVRLEEKVSGHHETIKRYGSLLDKLDDRVRLLENNQSEDKGKDRINSKVVAWILTVLSSATVIAISILFKGR